MTRGFVPSQGSAPGLISVVSSGLSGGWSRGSPHPPPSPQLTLSAKPPWGALPSSRTEVSSGSRTEGRSQGKQTADERLVPGRRSLAYRSWWRNVPTECSPGCVGTGLLGTRVCRVRNLHGVADCCPSGVGQSPGFVPLGRGGTRGGQLAWAGVGD